MNLANALSMLLVFLIGFAAHRASLCIAVQWQARWFEELTGLQNTRSTAGGYINSNNRNSVYLGAQWLPMAHGPVKLGVVPKLAKVSSAAFLTFKVRF